ncbi:MULTISPECIES: hypothetical protein [unclassified Caballeronia]|uniref:hypothetical protein n=1 Tax=unclassified Caballeronia TaxID=2646786 RepID=UPI001F2CADE6|nr:MULTISPECIES: hypothetical protein [unclassified Caballeronia]MCE4547930.1 hypothetical protein [Caballeronia sp. PC1]MCE4548156.1 hypothetical protein [Caballeronia sp. PC1]MCE4575820.1 hypothetical protein [Caballeronia sp. CLC5]
MLTSEGADDAEIIIRPCSGGGWQVEVPTEHGKRVTFACSEQEALVFARESRPEANVRILPATD